VVTLTTTDKFARTFMNTTVRQLAESPPRLSGHGSRLGCNTWRRRVAGRRDASEGSQSSYTSSFKKIDPALREALKKSLIGSPKPD